MACNWESIRFYTDDLSSGVGYLEGKVTGCTSNKIIASFPATHGDPHVTILINEDGTFKRGIKLHPFNLDCHDPIRLRLACYGSSDPSCVWDNQLIFGCICFTPYIEIAPPGENFMSLDQFSVYGDLVPPDGSPAPGCNLNGPYRLRITLNGLDTDITWREQILDGSGSPQQEIPDTANHVEITYNLNAPGGALVLVTALIVPKGDYAQCPITPLTVSFGGCGDVNCEDYGYYESSTPGECQRCPDGQIWDTVNETCVDEPTEPTEPTEPIEPKSKFCKCKHWWCYLLGVGLSRPFPKRAS